MRMTAIFLELRPYLQEVDELAKPGTVYFIHYDRDSANENLRPQLARVAKRAGLTPWPKLF